MLNFGLPAPFSHRTSQAHVARSSADSARMFAVASYDPETLRVVSDAFDEAWKEYRALLPVEPVDAAATRSAMARRIMAAIDEGRRDRKARKDREVLISLD